MDEHGNAGGDERRRFPRLNAPVYFRPAHRRLPRRRVVDVGVGGMRVYSDESIAVGSRLEVELFLPDASSVTCLTEVVWVRPLDTEAPARFDIGLSFLDVPDEALAQLGQVLASEDRG